MKMNSLTHSPDVNVSHGHFGALMSRIQGELKEAIEEEKADFAYE
jgi:hypothetical protein